MDGSTASNSAEEEDELASLNSILICATLLALVGLGYRINLGKLRHLPESVAAMLLGLVVGGAVRFFGFKQEEQLLNFRGEFFFFVLLPPIILEAGLSLEAKAFCDNLGAILTFAVLGTLVSTWVVSYGLRVAARDGLIGLDVGPQLEICCHLFGALISAVDPVATIALFGGSQFRADPTLVSIINGEAVLNDAVAIVLFSSLSSHMAEVHPHLLSASVLGHFCVVSIGSLLMGLGAGALVSAAYRWCSDLKNFPEYEIAAMCLSAYMTFACAQLAGLSGIVVLFFFGIMLRHYNSYNLSEASKTSSKVTFRTLAMLSESCVFIYLGVVTALSIGRFHWDLRLIVFACALCVLGRAAHIFPCTAVLNMTRHKKLDTNMSLMMWISGLRGAIAFALALRIPCDSPQANRGDAECRNSDLLITTTISIVMLTTMGVGTCMETVATALKVIQVPGVDSTLVALGDDPNTMSFDRTPLVEDDFVALASDTEDASHSSAARDLSRASSMRAKGAIYEIFSRLDAEVLQPALGGPSRVRVTVSDVELPELKGFTDGPRLLGTAKTEQLACS